MHANIISDDYDFCIKKNSYKYVKSWSHNLSRSFIIYLCENIIS